MKKIIWLTLFISLLVVNGLAMAAEAFSGTYIPIPYRLAIVLAIVMVTLVFCGATAALQQATNEVQNAPKNSPKKQ